MRIFARSFFIRSISLLMFFMIQCSDNPADPPDTISIDLPLKMKSVYAVANYAADGNADSLNYLRVSSFYFDSAYTSFDTTFLMGTYEYLELELNGTPASGDILLSVTNNWVFFQNSEIIGAGADLMKLVPEMKVDTTRLPTEKYGYFSIYPRTLIQGQTYAVYRPANEGFDWGYAGVYREFNVKAPAVWEDHYGSDSGFEVAVRHVLLGFTMYFDLIIDQHGIVNSQNTAMEYITDENGVLIDSVLTYRINRRIVDYTVPSSVNQLSYYYTEVSTKGLKYIE